MVTNPFFSILSASLNNGATIRNTLESVKMQTCRDLEHIVIDGGSTDDTLSILEKYKGTYNLSWISENDKGIADALNKGVAKSRGAYLVVIQADDQLVDSDILARVVHLLKDESYDIYSFPVVLDDPIHGKFIRRPIEKLWWNRFKFIFNHQGAFVHRRVFEKIGEFREDFSIAMDYDFFYRALLADSSVKFHREPPVVIMGGSGIGTRPDYIRHRLKEEALVQEMNERNFIWRMCQIVFKRLYQPYKLWFLPGLKRVVNRGLSSEAARNRR